MNCVDKYIQSKNPYRLKRKEILNQVAIHFGISFHLCKNKQILCDAINDIATYNTHDPVTLEAIADIPMDELTHWWQNKRRYSAKTKSIEMLMKTKNTINPWVIDSASGILQSTDSIEYDTLYNMTHVPKLKKLGDMTCEYLYDDDVPDDVQLLFLFLDLAPDLYITPLGIMLQSDERTTKQKGFRLLFNGFRITRELYLQNRDLHIASLLQCAMKELLNCTTPLLTIVMLLKCIKNAELTKGESIIRSVFMHALEYDVQNSL